MRQDKCMQLRSGPAAAWRQPLAGFNLTFVYVLPLLPLLLKQLIHKLGLFGSSKVMPDPYAAGPELPAAFAQAVSLLLKTVLEGQTPVPSMVQQQMKGAPLFDCLIHLTHAAAEQLEQCSAADVASGGSGRCTASAAAAALNAFTSPDQQTRTPVALQLTASCLLFTHVREPPA
jgi:hypothetical protein